MIHSEVFRAQFSGNFNKDLPPTFPHDPEMFKKLVSLTHNNELKLTFDEQIEILNLADLYMMTEICSRLEETLSKQFTPDNVYGTYSRVNHEGTKKQCVYWICQYLLNYERDGGDQVSLLLKHIDSTSHMLLFVKAFTEINEKEHERLAEIAFVWCDRHVNFAENYEEPQKSERITEVKKCTEEILDSVDLHELTSDEIIWFSGWTLSFDIGDPKKILEVLVSVRNDEN